MRSRSRGRVSNLMEYESPEHPPPITPSRRPPSSGDTPSLAMAERIFFTARSVTCKPWWGGACGAAGCGCAATAPSAGFDSILTKVDILPFPIARVDETRLRILTHTLGEYAHRSFIHARDGKRKYVE